MSVAVKRLDWSASELRQAAKGLRDATQVRRVLALALVLEGASRTEAATACGMDRQTLRDWVHRYNAEGIDGLIDREAPGRPPRLTPAQEAELKAIVLAGPDLARDGVVRWRRIDLQRVIGERFDVRLHERTVGKILAKLEALSFIKRARAGEKLTAMFTTDEPPASQPAEDQDQDECEQQQRGCGGG